MKDVYILRSCFGLKGFVILLLLVAFSVTFATAQKVEILMNSRSLTTNDALVLTVRVSNFKGSRVPSPNWPNIKGLTAAGASSASESFNGVTSITFSRSYFANKPGKYTVPDFIYEVNGGSHKRTSAVVTFKQGNGKMQQNGNDPLASMLNDPYYSQRNQVQKPLTYKSLDADYFLSVNLDKETCYIGEQVHGEVVLYVAEADARKIKVDSRAIAEMQQRVKNNGFWQEIIELRQIPAARVPINGKSYIAYTLYQNILFPVKTGDIAFKEIYLDGMKLAVATNADPMSRFTGRDIKYENIIIKASDRTLQVKPLPPTDLPNAVMVGKFKVEAKLSKLKIETGNNLDLEVKIAGDGNMGMMPDPTVRIPESFESYEPSTKYSSKIQGNGLYGSKTYTWSMLPRRNGKYDLGPFAYYYFDPETEAYDSIVVSNLAVTVTGDDIENQRIKASGIDQFYASAMESSGDSLKTSSIGTGWVLLCGIVLVNGMVITGILRKRSKAKSQSKVPDENPWI